MIFLKKHRVIIITLSEKNKSITYRTVCCNAMHLEISKEKKTHTHITE